jgi:TRAP transporter 4TM/12TM fusion protein
LSQATEKIRTPLEWIILLLGVGMSVFHIHIAYSGGYEDQYQRGVSYLFGMAMIYLIYRRPVVKGPWGYVIVGVTFLLAVTSTGFPALWDWNYFQDRLYYVDPLRPIDFFFGITIILLTLEAARRTINNALPLISLFFVVYSWDWVGPYFPWEMAHKGASFMHVIDHQYMTYDGIWTTPMNVFSVYIFLFILFGAFLERMGASEFYVNLSMAVTGHLRGGPAKAAIFASAMTGTIMGSTNANVVTTGSFTIPMMKRTGFRPETAAGIETAASTGGQIMPPVMGASAFLIVEFTGISYWDIVRVSIIPAALYFFSVYALVHFESRKLGLVGLPKDQVPRVGPIMKEGWFYLLPPIIIIVVLMTGRPVPYAGLYGIGSVIILAALKGGLVLLKKAREEGVTASELVHALLGGVWNIVEAMEHGARNSLPIAAAVGTVGLIMGALFQSGLGLKFASMVTSLAGGSLLLGIFLVGVASFVLGMGLPTSAAYIVLSVMAVPAMLELGEPVGLTLMAAHLIVFWYSLDSCFTPPVCVPAYTAAGIAGANPSKAAWSALMMAKGMYVMPLMFAFTPILALNRPMAIAETAVAAVFGFTALAQMMIGHSYFPLSTPVRVILGVAAALLFWPKIVLLGVVLPGVMLHATGALILGGVFLIQRKRLAVEGEPAPAVLETA